MKQLFTRSITGLIYVAIIVGSLLFLPATLFPLVCIILALCAIKEFHHLFSHEGGDQAVAVAINAAGAAAVIAPVYIIGAGHPVPQSVALSVILWAIWFVAAGAYELRKQPSSIAGFMVSMSSSTYIVIPLYLAALAAATGCNMAVLALFIMLWLNDTGAYCVGSLFGRHRLCERLSPKKSWEGFWGGLIFTVAGACLTTPWYLPGHTPLWGISVGIIISVVATWGDLVESMLKRSQGVKDAGHILPGHGGVLDRIDSLLLAFPAFAAMLLLAHFL